MNTCLAARLNLISSAPRSLEKGEIVSSDKHVTPSEEEQQESLFREALEEGEYDYQRPRRGEIRDGIILRKDSDQIIVDIGAKREGIVPASDLEKLGPEAVAELEVGDQVAVYVLRPESHDGDVIVSINMARQMADWDNAEKLMQAGEILEKTVTGYNKGGLLVQVGQLQGFIPRSHIVDLSGRTEPGTPQERLSQMIGQQLPLKVIEVNRRQRRLILSERAAWREWRAEQKKRLLADLEVDDVRTGRVTSLADFGAFVDLGGADGLIHLSELSWDRGKKPSDLLRVGDEIEVKIISLDRERKRIGLSVKRLKPNPWETLEERYAIGQYIDVEVTNLAKFGAFARLEEGVEGLIHISELSDESVQHPSEVVRVGQVITVQILSIDPQRKRVGLSLRRVPEHLRMPPETEAEVAEEPEELEPGELVAEGAVAAEAGLEYEEEPEAAEVAVADVEAADVGMEPIEERAEPGEAEDARPGPEVAHAADEAPEEQPEQEPSATEVAEVGDAVIHAAEELREPDAAELPIAEEDASDEEAPEAAQQQDFDLAAPPEPHDVQAPVFAGPGTGTQDAAAAGVNGDNVTEEETPTAPASEYGGEPQTESGS